MAKLKYKNYLIRSGKIEERLPYGYVQTFDVFEGKKIFYIQLRVTSITLSQISKSFDYLQTLFSNGIKKIIDLFICGEEPINKWNYFEYDRSGEWVRSDKVF